MNLKKAIENRCDCKRFDLKKVDWRKVVRAIDFARYTQGVGNHFGVRFIMVTDEGKISRLADACQQKFVGGANMVVVAVSDDKSMVRSYGDRASEYCRKHGGAVVQNFLLGLESEGLSTCWVLYFVDEQVKDVLGIPGGAAIEGIFPIGRMNKKARSEKRVRKLDNILFFEEWGNKKMEPTVKVGRDAI